MISVIVVADSWVREDLPALGVSYDEEIVLAVDGSRVDRYVVDVEDLAELYLLIFEELGPS